uniref:H0117D06-OSIGBa0088B06.6 protein n=1 Tax=Oryza sativa TaxID=4530 RepID=Q01HJ2_ORYSA|nr:H0117D06-OSIGBa0088B06.6 [Oryza sativa]
MMVMRLKGLMVMMSCQKYGSNVIEKCLTFGSIHDRLVIAADITGAGEDQILMMMMDEHGNYVIQKMLEMIADEWVVDLIVTVVNRNFFRLIHNIHGRHVTIPGSGKNKATGWSFDPTRVHRTQNIVQLHENCPELKDKIYEEKEAYIKKLHKEKKVEEATYLG